VPSLELHLIGSHRYQRGRHGVHHPAGSFFDWVSLNQSYHPAPLYSLKGAHDLVPVQYGKETFRRSGRVARAGLNIFPKDASRVFKGTN
jgi:hypothetical protein